MWLPASLSEKYEIEVTKLINKDPNSSLGNEVMVMGTTRMAIKIATMPDARWDRLVVESFLDSLDSRSST